MRTSLILAAVIAIAALLLSQNAAICQEPNVANLKKEIELLKRENELLKRENELLKQEIASLKKGGSKSPSETGAEAALSVTVDDVEYVYQGMERNGADAFITLLATSKKGEHAAPHGMMTLTDGEGNNYQGMPAGGFGAPQVLREGVPNKLVWRFGPNPLTKKGSAPSAKITRFVSLSVEATRGGGKGTVEFRDVPAVVAKSKAK
jgi:cell division protein FtsB